MASFLPPAIEKIIEEFAKLPGIGPKSAERLAIYLLHSPHQRLDNLGQAVLGLKNGVQFCEQCWNVAENTPCSICLSAERDQSVICVVEDVLDVMALEKTFEFKGLYHVLHGLLSPVDRIGVEQLKILELGERLKNSDTVTEIIIATNPSLQGEATAIYIQKMLAGMEIKVTRLARGLPSGASLDYTDSLTLSRALSGRQEF